MAFPVDNRIPFFIVGSIGNLWCDTRLAGVFDGKNGAKRKWRHCKWNNSSMPFALLSGTSLLRAVLEQSACSLQRSGSVRMRAAWAPRTTSRSPCNKSLWYIRRTACSNIGSRAPCPIIINTCTEWSRNLRRSLHHSVKYRKLCGTHCVLFCYVLNLVACLKLFLGPCCPNWNFNRLGLIPPKPWATWRCVFAAPS